MKNNTMSCRALALLVATLTLALAAQAQQARPAKPKRVRKPKPVKVAESTDVRRVLFDTLARDIRDQARHKVHYAQSARPEAGVVAGDRDGADIVLRRATALLTHIRKMDKGPALTAEAQALAGLAKQVATTPLSDAAARYALYNRLCDLRKTIALANPLLDFDKVILLGRRMPGTRHMNPQYCGFVGTPGGGVFVLDKAFSDKPVLRNILAGAKIKTGRLKGQSLADGAIAGLELDWDAKTIYFAWTEAKLGLQQPKRPDGAWFPEAKFTYGVAAGYWAPESCYHIIKASIDPAGGKAAGDGAMAQLTDGPWNDHDPCVLPNGRLVFISERRGGYGRCHGQPFPTYAMYGMMGDGTDIIPLSYHETNEWHPSVSNEGMILYTRWDYVDRDADIAHHPWLCYPDGRDPRSHHGNYPENNPKVRPTMEMHCRAIPNSHRYVAVATPHHGLFYGSLVLVDHRIRDDRRCSQLKRVTPEEVFPEAEGPWGRYAYGTPWPLSEDFYLAVYNPTAGYNFSGRHDLYLIDSFGNRVHLTTLPDGLNALDPMPLRPRKRPPVIPIATQQAAAEKPADGKTQQATISVMNAYEAELPWPKGTKITALRVIQVYPKTTVVHTQPEIGCGKNSLTRAVLGTVPVEADGSAQFVAPVGVPIYFQALDAKGLAVQTMRSATYVHEGERLTCIGCHEDKHTPSAVAGRTPMAMRKPPRTLTPEFPEATRPLTFPRLVQPVLDKHCLPCHSKPENRAKAPSLSGTKFGRNGWSEAYWTLAKHAWTKHGNAHGAFGRGDGWVLNKTSYSIPGQVGARASKLLPMLLAGHPSPPTSATPGKPKVKLPPEALHRITLWMDANSVFYGDYKNIEAQARGGQPTPELE